ncbi:hypothetical protein GCM10023081_46680 [Arthrobacter ginkgonis]|uniref:Uncharacterized protein n=1 Tax=Arthrobacter ginkgonis TaxID=1630594 RepID=A0ABP7DGU7_9MICC
MPKHPSSCGLGRARETETTSTGAPRKRKDPASCCLRTQQCAKDPNGAPRRIFPTPRGAYSNRTG